MMDAPMGTVNGSLLTSAQAVPHNVPPIADEVIAGIDQTPGSRR